MTNPTHNPILTPFHLAVQVRDIEEARDFYGRCLGFKEGRSSQHWIDFDMFGHQFVTHLNKAIGIRGQIQQITNSVDSHAVPVPHFGVVLEFSDWSKFAERVRPHISEFIIEPYIRFKDQPGEQGTFFFKDPSGNALEFKAFKDINSQLFAN